MGTLGSYLREAREARGLDLRDAAQQTRISIAYLKAIETEDFSKLPGEVFVKGFLKSYTRFLQLPEDEVMKRYGELRTPPAVQAPAAGQKEEPGGSPKPPRQEPSPARPEYPAVPARNLEPFLWGGILFVALVLFILVARPAKQPVKVHDASSSAVTPTTQTTAPAGGPTLTVRGDKLYLDIEALEDTWVLVRTDSSPQKKAVLRKGESVTWSADERFLLSYGSVGAARLLLNGKELAVAGAKSAVVRDLLVTAKGIAQQKLEAEQKPRKPKPQAAPAPLPATGPAVTVPVPAAAPAPGTAPEPAPDAAPAPAPATPSAPKPLAPEG